MRRGRIISDRYKFTWAASDYDSESRTSLYRYDPNPRTLVISVSSVSCTSL